MPQGAISAVGMACVFFGLGFVMFQSSRSSQGCFHGQARACPVGADLDEFCQFAKNKKSAMVIWGRRIKSPLSWMPGHAAFWPACDRLATGRTRDGDRMKP